MKKPKPLIIRNGYALISKDKRLCVVRKTWEACMAFYIQARWKSIVLKDSDLERYERLLKKDGEIIPVTTTVTERKPRRK